MIVYSKQTLKISCYVVSKYLEDLKNCLVRCSHYNNFKWWKQIAEQSGRQSQFGWKKKIGKKKEKGKKNDLWVVVCVCKKKSIKNIWISGRKPSKLKLSYSLEYIERAGDFHFLFYSLLCWFSFVMISFTVFVI